MRVAVDAFGGDHAPLEIIKGSAWAVKELGVEIILVGNEEIIKKTIEENNIPTDGFSYHHTDVVITMEDDPMTAVRSKKNSSMSLAMRLVKDGEADAVVSAGNSGALLTGATLIIKRIKGISRAAMAPVMPTDTGATMLIDSGANVECTPEYLLQFGIMGSIYMKNLFGVENARVGLLNNGSESTKGTPLQTQAYELLSNTTNINFIGNVEGNSVMNGICDVLVTDGFTGNIFLKTIEGMGKFFMSSLKPILKKKPLAALMIKKDLIKFKKQFDASEQGGAPLLGLARPVIKAHGSSDAKAIKNAVRGAIKMLESNIISKTEAELSIALEQNN